MTYENHPEFFAFHDSCTLATDDAPIRVYKNKNEVFLSIYFKVLKSTTSIGIIDPNILPAQLIIATCSGQNGTAYPLVIHPGNKKIYCDTTIPAGIYGMSITYPVKLF